MMSLTGETSILEALVGVLKYDTSPEVRRAALVNIHVTADTISHLLTRTRDIDCNVRKHTYSTVLERNCNIGEGEDSKSVGNAHPVSYLSNTGRWLLSTVWATENHRLGQLRQT